MDRHELIEKIKKINYKEMIIPAVLFGIVQAICLSIYNYESFIYSFNDASKICYMLEIFFLHGFIFYAVSTIASVLLHNIKKAGSDSYSRKKSIWNKYAGALSFVIILACWMPWLIIFYPGSVWFDMSYQIDQYYGYYDFSLHPVFATLVMGKCMDIGKHLFNSDNVGAFIYILLQSIVCAYAYSRVVSWINKHKTPVWVQLVAIAYYALLPVFGSVAQYGVKDVMTYGLFTLYTVIVIECYEQITNKEKLSIKNILKYAVITIILSLYRKEMIMVCCIVTCVFALYALIRRDIKKVIVWCALAAVAIMAYKGFNVIIVNGVMQREVYGGYDSSESMSIPLQQIARTVYYNDDIISDEEKEVLNSCFSYGYNEIAGHYNPYLSDPIKYSFDTGKEGFWKVYFSLLKKAPLTYVEATIANSFGYYSVIPPLPSTVHDAPTNGTPGDRYLYYINIDMDGDIGMIDIAYKDSTAKYRGILTNYALGIRDIPVLSLIYSLGFYTWVYLFFLYWQLKNKKNLREIIIYIPTGLIILVCIASPVNDCLRYFVSVIAAMPIIMSWTYIGQREEN